MSPFFPRYYDPATGRFISEDPINFAAGDANLYRYVGNSPTIFVDPTGLFLSSPLFGTGGPSAVEVNGVSFNPVALAAGAEITAREQRGNPLMAANGRTDQTLRVDDPTINRFLNPNTADINLSQSVPVGENVSASRLIGIGRALAEGASVSWSSLAPGQQRLIDHGYNLALQNSQAGPAIRSGYTDEFGWHRSFCMSCHDKSNPNSVLKRQVADYTLDSSWEVVVGRAAVESLVGVGSGLGFARRGAQVARVVPEVALNPSRRIFGGMEVRAVRHLSHVDDTTLRAMAKNGFAPKDINGKKLILHHLDQNPAGPVVEMPGFRHSIGNRIQHPLGNAPGVGITAEQRTAFNAWRQGYWKSRALEELTGRGLTP